MRSEELLEPGCVTDLFSAFYPLGAVSPVLRELRLEDHGLRWSHARHVLSHPLPDGRAAVLSRNEAETCASLDELTPGDGAAWSEIVGLWRTVEPYVVPALLRPFPPTKPALHLLKELRPKAALEFARFGMLSARQMSNEHFVGPGGGLLISGNAMHSDVGPESPPSGFLGWMLASLGQTVGFPVPVGGAGALIDALVTRLKSKGGALACDKQVVSVMCRDGKAVAVRCADGTDFEASRAIIADVGAVALYTELLVGAELPHEVKRGIRRFQPDNSTVKLDWTINGDIPWTHAQTAEAGTVHICDSLDELTDVAADLARGLIPAHPFLVMGQMTASDSTRSPLGITTAWAYTHVPQQIRGDAGGRLTGTWDEAETAEFVERVEQRIERLAPGFQSRIRERHVMRPSDMQERDANLIGGAIGAGTSQLSQLLTFRPFPSWSGGARTFVPRLYLGSAAAHPGGGVHGACGANAAHAALQDAGLLRRARHLLRR